MKSSIAAIVLAGGKGSRMQSDLPKVLHQIGGEPMIYASLRILQQLGLAEIVVVVGYAADQVKAAIEEQFEVSFGYQQAPLGTGDAVSAGIAALSAPVNHLLVVNGDDSGFYSPNTLTDFLDTHQANRARISMMTLEIDEDLPLGRVVRDQNGQFKQILERDSYYQSGLNSREINCGAYVIDLAWAKQILPKIQSNPNGEYYLTDLLNIARQTGEVVNLFKLADPDQWVGVNTPEDLSRARAIRTKKQNSPIV